MWDYRAVPLKVIDGDTLRLNVDLGFYARHRVDVRLLDVSAPESGEPGGIESRDFVEAWLRQTAMLEWPLRVATQINKASEPIERTSFTRYIGDIYDIDDVVGRWLNEDLRKFLAQHPEWGTGM